MGDKTYKVNEIFYSVLGADARNVEWCVELVKRHPDWRLSVQSHKLLGVR